ncbi:hypothetical protein [Lederbergia citrea]|nr:hypothetical protein [Lederbergia citrea]
MSEQGGLTAGIYMLKKGLFANMQTGLFEFYATIVGVCCIRK